MSALTLATLYEQVGRVLLGRNIKSLSCERTQDGSLVDLAIGTDAGVVRVRIAYVEIEDRQGGVVLQGGVVR